MFGFQLINDIDSIQREMDQVFQRLNFAPAAAASNDIRFKLSEEDDAYLLRAALPGLDSDKLEINLLGRELTVRGDFTEEALPEQVQWHRRERKRGAFERSFTLADSLDADNLSAAYKNGILSIRLPKAAAALPKKISVNINQ